MYCEWSADEIHIDKLEIFAHHGVYPEERREGQTFYVNAVLYLDIGEAGRSDDLEQTVDYGAVCHFVTDWMGNNTCSLLEAVACRLAEAILLKYKMLSGIDLEIVKPYAPVRLPFRGLSVRVRRNWHRAYVGVGSNVGDRHAHIKAAVEALRAKSSGGVETDFRHDCHKTLRRGSAGGFCQRRAGTGYLAGAKAAAASSAGN